MPDIEIEESDEFKEEYDRLYTWMVEAVAPKLRNGFPNKYHALETITKCVPERTGNRENRAYNSARRALATFVGDFVEKHRRNPDVNELKKRDL